MPLDGSRLAEAVLPAAAELARRFGARLTLLHVLERDAPSTVHGQPHLSGGEAARAYLASIAARLSAAGLDVDTHVHPNLERDVAGSIGGHAAELGSDLVVLATHGESDLRDVVVGSIAELVLGRGDVPILLVRPEYVSADQPCQIGSVLVPLDGTPDSERILPLAEAVAQKWQAELILLRVVPTRGSLPSEQAAVATMLPAATTVALQMEEEAADRYLEQLVRGLGERGIAATGEVRRGDPTALVLEEARRLGVDLVAMATHGRSGLDAFWSGSIGHRLAERLVVPVLIYRSSRRGRGPSGATG